MTGIVIALLVIALAAGAFLYFRRSVPSLPAAQEERRPAIGEVGDIRDLGDAARRPTTGTRSDTTHAALDGASTTHEAPAGPAPELASPIAAAAELPSAARSIEAPPVVPPAGKLVLPRFPAPPTTPQPRPRPSVPAVETPRVTQQRPAAAPIPMPVDKPAVATREQREAVEIAAKKSERERYREGLTKTRKGFIARLAGLLRGKPKVDSALKDEIEEVLLTADIGAKAADRLLAKVTQVLDRDQVADATAVWSAIREQALAILDVDARPLSVDVEAGPYTLLMIGVNGVGKTTTLGKLAARHVEAGRRVLLVAGDTFRAAATEQLEVWARRSSCDIHIGKEGADPSSVIFDGITRGRKEGYDVVLCDTAGRLHTRKELMAELEKIRRSADKALSRGREPVSTHDTFLVLDATIGQNALAQAALFKETMDFTGLVLTKLDGTAKGGVVLGVCDELRVPIRYIGIGEGVDDLRSFDPGAFCDALFTPDAASTES